MGAESTFRRTLNNSVRMLQWEQGKWLAEEQANKISWLNGCGLLEEHVSKNVSLIQWKNGVNISGDGGDEMGSR